MLRRIKSRLFVWHAERHQQADHHSRGACDSDGSVQPKNERFQRWPSLLKREIDSGAMSRRQNDCGGAPIAHAMAARMTEECVTAIDRRGYACSPRSQSATRW